MSGRIHRQQRRFANQVGAEHSRMVLPAVKAAFENAQTALTNEEITRQRVERLEAVVGRGFWGRFKWLLLSR